jgi:hypothetical protein
LRERAVFGAVLTAARVTDGTGEIACVANFDEGETTMLLVVWTETAVVGAAVFDGGVVYHGLLGGLDEDFAGAAIVVDVVGNEDAGVAMLRTALEHPDFAVFEDDFGVNATIADGADGDGYVVEEIRAEFFSHVSS